MSSVLNFLQRLFLGIWIGEMVFFAAVFAPRVFKVLERHDASKLQNAVFPPYFMLGLICAAVVGLTLALGVRPSVNWKLWTSVACFVFAAGIFAYSRWVFTPKIAALGEVMTNPASLAQVTDEMRAQFQSLHKLSVQSNAGALLALLALLGLLV